MRYLKCKYEPGLFKCEYVIHFRVVSPTIEGWMLVNREDVVQQSENKGLVRILIYAEDENRCLVGINNVGDHRQSRRYVPREDIVTQ